MCNEIPYPVMEYKQLHSNMQRCGIDKPRIPNIQLKTLAKCFKRRRRQCETFNRWSDELMVAKGNSKAY